MNMALWMPLALHVMMTSWTMAKRTIPTRSYYLVNRAICTGLGDGLGTTLTLAALVRLDEENEGSIIIFPWCEDP